MTWVATNACGMPRNQPSRRRRDGDRGRQRRRLTRQRSLGLESLEDRRLLSVGPYAPAAGQPGSTAIHMDDPEFVAWASGWENYVAGDGVAATWQTPQKTLGKATGEAFDIASLGRGGEITLTFDRPVRNGVGWDFAVFENAVADSFLELGYVEVSSDGANFFRFPNDSLTADPVPAFGELDPTRITGLAGKYRQAYGTPFDLQTLAGLSPLLDVHHVTHIRIVDITGDGTFPDSDGDPIYDPYPTTDSAGFDLDAVGVLHAVEYVETTLGFEDVGAGLAAEGHWNGPDPDGVEQPGGFGDTVVVGSFESGGLEFNNTYSLNYGSWTGWAYSNTTDTTTAGYTNQFSSYAGGGAGGSPTYGVAFVDDTGSSALPTVRLTAGTDDMFFHSLSVSNTTYTALSLLNGDAFAKRFGGTSGDDPDWLLLSVAGRDAGGQSVGEVEFYLADYRFTDNSLDYVVEDWSTLDLTPLRGASSLEFQLTSSDVGKFGMNTPAFFAVDDIVLAQERMPLDISVSRIPESAGAAAAAATVGRYGADLTGPLVVSLHSDDTSEATVPASVTIPSGEESVVFDIAAVDDNLVDGAQVVTLTASAAGYADGTGSLEVTDDDQLTLIVSLDPDVVSEAAGAWAAIGTVARNDGDLSSALTVTLSSDDAGEATVPPTVVIPADQSSVQFPVTAVNDAVVDGAQTVSITAEATGYIFGSSTLEVADDDVLRLSVVIDVASVTENAGAAATAGTVTRNDADLSSPLTVTLQSTDTSEITVAAQITIPANQASAVFAIDAVDDAIVDGTRGVTIRAFADDYVAGSDSLHVADDDRLTLTLTIAEPEIEEGAGFGAATGTIHRNDGNLSRPLSVTLQSGDTGEATVPASVTIPAGQASIDFPIAAVDDAIVDGSQSVVITASAAGYLGGSDTLNVTDDDALTLSVSITPDSVSEGAGAGAATGGVTRNDGDLSSPLTVTLTSDDTTAALVASSLVIPAGQATAWFSIDAVDDALVDGPQVVRVTVAAAGYLPGDDTLQVTDDDVRTLSVEIADASVSEAAGVGITTGTVRRNDADLSQALTVTLSSGDTTEADVATAVTIPAGQQTASFAIDAIDDTIVDGRQDVTISASAAGYVSGHAELAVTDDDQLTLRLSITESVLSEGAGAAAATGTVTRNDGDVSRSLTVQLSSDDTSAATVPASVVIPANQASATFPIDAVDDTLVDGSQNVLLTASATAYIPDSKLLVITDDDVPALTVDIPASAISERDAPPTARLEDRGATLGAQSYWNGSDGSGGFQSDGLAFNNTYDEVWDSWSGWSYSNTTDTTTPGFGNQYSAYPGRGAPDSSTYAVANAYPGGYVPTVELTDATTGLAFRSLMVTNTTYAALSMRDGDAFAKQFGGPDGTDPDWFLLTIEGFDGNDNSVGTVDFYLADYRAADPEEDYIVDTWTAVAVSDLAGAVRLDFSLSSSDTGEYGMNTPAYFAVDNIVLSGPPAAVGEVSRNDGERSEPLTITLSSDDVSEVTVPDTVTIPAGQTSVQFPIHAVNDAVVDSLQTVTVSAVRDGYASGSQTLGVTDDDLRTLTLSIASSAVSESAGAQATTATVHRNDADLADPLTVTLSSDDPGEAAVPASVVIPAGQSSISFPVDAMDDALVDGTQTAMIVAAATGYADGRDSVDVTDDDVPTLTLTITPDTISEADAPPTVRLEDAGARLPEESYWNGADGSRGFTSDGVHFNNRYDAIWGSWAGWSYSNTTDTTTAGYANQYSAYAGGGAVDSRTYAVATAYAGDLVPTVELGDGAAGLSFRSLMVTNTTYAALSMLRGDVFAKQFGGPDGTDPDWFLLTIEGFDAEENSVGSVEFYLADYRAAEPAEDYIVDSWTEVDVSGLVGADKLAFSLSSSDVGAYGMNTPAYFAVDNIVLSAASAATGVVHRNDENLSEPLTVTLASDDASEASVPVTVTIPAGQAWAQFPISAADDAVVDGTQTATIAAAAEGYAGDSETLDVTDDDLPTLTLTVTPEAISEADAPPAATGLVHRNAGDLSEPLTVTLSSADTSAASVPSTVTIPAGQAWAQVSISAVDDAVVDGTQTATIAVAAEGYTGDSKTLEVMDDEVPTLTLTVTPEAVSESDAPATVRFEDAGATLYEQSFWNGSDTSGGFTSDGVSLNNDYNAAWDSWSGWSYSNTTDATTAGYANQYSAVTGSGAGGSRTYAVAYVSSYAAAPMMELTEATAELGFRSLMVTNTTYAALSMRDGDAFVKQFGGPDGTDPDWFLLTIEGFDGQENSVGTVDFYLADYRAADPADDYIVDTWTEVDVSSLVGAERLAFSLSSSDVGEYGMNTPAYFAVDHILLAETAAATGVVHRNDGDLSQPLTVTLSSDDASEAAVPATVTIPAGQAWAQFPLAAVDDAVVDGMQTVTIAAAASGYTSDNDALDVTDDDVPRLTLTLVETTVSEDAGPQATFGIVHRNEGNLDDALMLSLVGDDATEATVPAAVTIPAGQASVQFPVDAIDDALLDGVQTVRIGVSADGYDARVATLTVTDREELTLDIADERIQEKVGATTLTVTRTDSAGELTVNLAVSDDTEASIPPVVVMADGQAMAIVPVTALDDDVDDGIQTVAITASGPGYEDGVGMLEVTDYMSWQSYTHPCDVDVSGWIVPVDILLVINDINSNGSRELPVPYAAGENPPPYVDVSGNFRLEPEDILIVIDWINSHGAGPVPGLPAPSSPAGSPGGQPEGEGTTPRETPLRRGDQRASVSVPSKEPDIAPSVDAAPVLPVLGSGTALSPSFLLPKDGIPIRDTSEEFDEILDLISRDISRAWQADRWGV